MAERLLSQQMEQSPDALCLTNFLRHAHDKNGTNFTGEFYASPVVQNRLSSYLAPFGVTNNATNDIHDPHLYLALTEASMDGMAICDAEGLFICRYAAHAQNLGYKGLGELTGKN